MGKVYVIDRNYNTRQAENLVDKLKKCEGREVKLYRNIDDFIKKEISNNNIDKNKSIVLWHISDKEEIKALKTQFEGIDKETILFIGKSGQSDIREEAKKQTNFFKLVVGNFDTSEVKTCFKFDENLIDIDSVYSCLSGESKKAEFEKVIYYLLHLFLPLDIDMQALGILWNERDEKAKAVSYLKDMLDDAGRDHYKNKFDKVKALKGEIIDNKLQTELDSLIGNDKDDSVLYDFLTCLDDLKEKSKYSILSKKDVQKVVNYLSEGLEKENYSFHDWYCALAECLRGKIDNKG
jgi:hypothetical protein